MQYFATCGNRWIVFYRIASILHFKLKKYDNSNCHFMFVFLYFCTCFLFTAHRGYNRSAETQISLDSGAYRIVDLYNPDV